MTRKTLTYGVLPTREEFEEAFTTRPDSVAGLAPDGPGVAPSIETFSFTNDPRVGTCGLTAGELWEELALAMDEWLGNKPECRCDDARVRSGDHKGCWEAAGQWCSDVLGVLGFEWV